MSTHKIRYYKKEHGALVPYRLVLDENLVELEHSVDLDLAQRMQQALSMRATATTSKVEVKDGLTVVRTPGAVHVTGADDQAVKISQFVSLVGPNPFPEHDALRTELAEELAALEKRAKDNGEECRNCDRAEVIRRYSARLRELLPVPAS